jgi:hypothetical protein
MPVRANHGAMVIARKLRRDSRPARMVHARRRVATASVRVHLVTELRGAVLNPVLVSSGSRRGARGCAMIFRQQDLARWIRVSRKRVQIGSQCGNSGDSARNHKDRRMGHAISVRHNLRDRRN